MVQLAFLQQAGCLHSCSIKLQGTTQTCCHVDRYSRGAIELLYKLARPLISDLCLSPCATYLIDIHNTMTDVLLAVNKKINRVIPILL